MTFATVLAAFIIILWGYTGRHLQVNFHPRQTVSAILTSEEDPDPG